MAGDELSRRRSISFLQAEGLAQLPTQLSGHDVSQKTKVTLLWLLSEIDGEYGSQKLITIWTDIFELYHDEMPTMASARQEELKNYIDNASGSEILELIQFLARSRFLGQSGYQILEKLCEHERLAYRLVGVYGSVPELPTLFPVASPEQADALQRDLRTINQVGSAGARKHLRASSEALSTGDFAGSIRESIHAVESTAKSVTGGAKADLAGALKKLESRRPLHPALRQALEKLYAWTSDEKGVRHALIDADSTVTEAQAIFMLSACAAFAAWLVREGAT